DGPQHLDAAAPGAERRARAHGMGALRPSCLTMTAPFRGAVLTLAIGASCRTGATMPPSPQENAPCGPPMLYHCECKYTCSPPIGADCANACAGDRPGSVLPIACVRVNGVCRETQLAR